MVRLKLCIHVEEEYPSKSLTANNSLPLNDDQILFCIHRLEHTLSLHQSNLISLSERVPGENKTSLHLLIQCVLNNPRDVKMLPKRVSENETPRAAAGKFKKYLMNTVMTPSQRESDYIQL